MNKRIISLGDLVLDVMLAVNLPVNPDVNHLASDRRLELGGAANFMIAAQHMGADVYAAGVVGDDSFGKLIVDGLAQEGIHVEHVFTQPNSFSTIVLALTDPQTRRHAFVAHYGNSAAVDYPRTFDAIVASMGAVYLPGYTFLEQSFRQFALQATQCANQHGIPVYFDAGPAFADISVEFRRDILHYVDTLLMNDDEIGLFLENTVGGTDYRRLLAYRAKLLIIKNGDKGCTFITADGETHYPAYPVEVVDTVGAGDCFAAAFIAMQLEGRDVDECAQIANAMGAAAVQKTIAGRQVPTCEDVSQILQSASAGIQLSCP